VKVGEFVERLVVEHAILNIHYTVNTPIHCISLADIFVCQTASHAVYLVVCACLVPLVH
jgi:hypothetical protein